MIDDPTPAPDKGFDARRESRTLLRTVRAGALATVAGDGMPFASLVTVATRPDGCPLLLLSRLATHTAHLEWDPRCSLLLARTGRGDPLAHPRLSLNGKAARLAGEDAQSARTRFLARNPKAALYADFADFGFWRITPDTASLNGGFGRAAQLAGSDLLTETSDAAALLASEQGALAHMNADHRDALALYGEILAKAGAGDWRTSGLDPDGIDLVCGERTARVDFDKRVTNPQDLRRVLVALAAEARTLGEPADSSGD